MQSLVNCLRSFNGISKHSYPAAQRVFNPSPRYVGSGPFINKYTPEPDVLNPPKKIFSGIQPTGGLHLGNYLGVVRKWLELQNNSEDVTYCIVDMHSITLPQVPTHLRENIFQVAATMIACGIDFDRSKVFVQSAVKEHTELSWILGCLITMARLGHLPQYKEKARSTEDIPLGLFIYPVLQAADIMLHKATHVPVGADQVQHIQLAQHFIKIFNGKFGMTFPHCHAMIDNKVASRIRSLRDPSKKMSKSDIDPKATIYLTDEPEVIVEKIKKSVTDFCSDVAYDPDKRSGVSNIIAIHSLVTGQSIKNIVEEAKTIDTGKYKLRVADAVVEHLRPIRDRIKDEMSRKDDLIHLLELGADKAREVAQETMYEVKQRVGLGAMHDSPFLQVQEETKSTLNINRLEHNFEVGGNTPYVVVPKQRLRVEKRRSALPVETHEMEMMPVKLKGDRSLFKYPKNTKSSDGDKKSSDDSKSKLDNLDLNRSEQIKQ
ncbi:tryptophan--tRNA ligase, mitochondrial-like [Teleopsis dalmanni]|uniref:tryptophan--tRNA ligase, mitochondrial-like n=1 Tax=Teleopsis dalmanni TaxID=139649 RepID=UPI0018CDD56E|nr:tryptophan--tRNA ligase, mitochondrial-like [Teleopsis dalmanni]XP_037938958.1 tryptophan--tRNA ligase, mitochondrial-like [Teleopsis dalmanni]